MNDAALSKPGAYAQIRVREPAGERTLGTRSSTARRRGRAKSWCPAFPRASRYASSGATATGSRFPQPGAAVRFDGRPLTRAARAAQRRCAVRRRCADRRSSTTSRTRLRLDVQHLVGNETIAPVATVAAVESKRATKTSRFARCRRRSARGPRPPCSPPTQRSRRAHAPRKPLSRKWVIAIGAVAAVVLALITLLSRSCSRSKSTCGRRTRASARRAPLLSFRTRRSAPRARGRARRARRARGLLRPRR